MRKRINRYLIGMLTAMLTLTPTMSTSAEEHFVNATSIKGVLINDQKQVPDVLDVGAGQVICNFPLSWSFDPNRLNACKVLYSTLEEKGIAVTLILLNDWSDNSLNAGLLPVNTPVDKVSYYAFNTNSEEGLNALRSTAGTVVNEFKDCVSNYVIGNEINDGEVWNYIGRASVDAYAAAYATAFRTWYDTIKGTNPAARVFIPFDFRWNCGQVEGFKYGVMDLLPRLNNYLRDTDYGIAWHAYPETFTDPVFNDDRYTEEQPDAHIINLKNLHVLTDYMSKPEMLSPEGKVRHLQLTEQGFTSDSPERGGECLNLQAATIAEAYNTAKANPYVEAFQLNRLQDEQVLLDAHYAFGLIAVDGTKKPSYEVYKGLQ